MAGGGENIDFIKIKIFNIDCSFFVLVYSILYQIQLDVVFQMVVGWFSFIFSA